MALGAQVMKKHGIDGFYISSLFEVDQELRPFFRKVIEMGRAYITSEYQQNLCHFSYFGEVLYMFVLEILSINS
jgi:hypothetical protein